MTTDAAVKAPKQDLIASDEFRRVIGNFATGVTVVTSRHDGQNFGATVSAFSSVSLEPPTLLVCLNQRNASCDAIRASKSFGVSILSDGQDEVAYKFATPGQGKFDGSVFGHGVSGVPLIDGALVEIECRVVEELQSGTHSVFFGEVLAAKVTARRPLTYFCGQFGRFEKIEDNTAYQSLRSRLLCREFSEGSVLDTEGLKAELGAEDRVFTNVLGKLVHDGLLCVTPNGDHAVAGVTLSMIEGAFNTRHMIELGVLDLVVGNVASKDLLALRSLAEDMLPLIVDGKFVDFERYLELNRDFHEALVSLAGNETLLAHYKRIRMEALIAQSRGNDRQTSDTIVKEHIELVDALEDGDLEVARATLKSHEESIRQQLLRTLSDQTGRS